MELDAVTFLSLLLFLPLATFYLSYHLHRRRGRLPPSPPALPLVGHLHLLTSMPHHALARLSNQLGPIFSLRLGRVPSVVVASPRLAREVLKTHDAALASRPALLSAQYLSFGCSDVTFSPAGPYWRQARRLCVSELLAPRRVAAFRLIRCQEVHRLLRSISSLAAAGSDGQAIDLSAGFLHLANDVLCRVAFGRRFSTAGFRLPEVLAESQARPHLYPLPSSRDRFFALEKLSEMIFLNSLLDLLPKKNLFVGLKNYDCQLEQNKILYF